MRLAWFITPHGYGHATRSMAVMQALHDRLGDDLRVELFTKLPPHLLSQSLMGLRVGYWETVCDLGLVQTSALTVDLEASIQRLTEFIPFDRAWVADLVDQVHRLGCEAVVCDVAPLGLAVAKRAKLPAIMLENFTWDWIYEAYADAEPRFTKVMRQIRALYSDVALWLQAGPACELRPGAVRTAPISRELTASREAVRSRLGIGEDQKMVMITMGGFGQGLPFAQQLRGRSEIFVVPGLEMQEENVVGLPHDASGFFHPDLIHGADLVVGKVGYSTVAEVWRAGSPFAYIPRPNFRESAVLCDFLAQERMGQAVAEADFLSGQWLERLPALLSLPRRPEPQERGADQAAEAMIAWANE